MCGSIYLCSTHFIPPNSAWTLLGQTVIATVATLPFSMFMVHLQLSLYIVTQFIKACSIMGCNFCETHCAVVHATPSAYLRYTVR